MAKNGLEDYTRELDAAISRIIDHIPYDRVKIWKDILFRPTETLKNEEKNASIARGAKDIALVNFIGYGIFGMLIMLVISFPLLMMFIFLSIISKKPSFEMLEIFFIILAVILGGVVVMTVFSTAGWLVGSTFEFILAKLLGGVGSFRKHAYLVAVQSAAFVLVTQIDLLLSLFIPFIGILLYPVTMLVSIYALYIRYLTIRQVHKLSKLSSIAVMALPMLLIFAVAILISVLVYSMIIVSALMKK